LEFIIKNSYLISQILGLFALACMAISYFQKNKTVFFTMQTAGNLFTVLSFFVQGEYFASVGCVIATIRTGIFSLFSSRNKEVPWWLVFVLCGATIVSCVLLWKSALDLIFMLGLIIFTLSFKVKDGRKMKFLLLVPNSMYCIFEFFSKSYTVLISTVIELVSLIVSIVIEELMNKKAKKLKEQDKNLDNKI
jgi:hypothetical protein